MRILLQRCPEIELLSITTNDSGAGLDWSPGTHAGRLGNTLYRGRSMEERLRTFFAALQGAANKAGGSLEISIKWTREPDPRRIALKLATGMAIENLEGPEATPFQAEAGFEEVYYSPYHPVIGIPQPMRVLTGLSDALRSTAARLVLNFGDRLHRDLYFEVYDRFRAAKTKPRTQLEQLALLRDIALGRVGEAKADDLLKLWLHVHESTPYLQILFVGGYLTDLGPVQQRWLTRPFVPYPEELTPDEKRHYRPFLFQAREETDAESLADIQAMTWAGWPSRLFLYKTTHPVVRFNREAATIARKLGDETQARRFEIFNCFLNTANHAISYQAQLDRVRNKPALESEPAWELQTRIGWDHQLMMETARGEIDNIAVLIRLLGDNPGEYLYLAGSRDEEDIRVLGPDIVAQLRRKLEIMNAHWEDYDRMFMAPGVSGK